MSFRWRGLVWPMAILGIGIAACGPSGGSPGTGGTWQVDCVAVLGTLPQSGQMPLQAIPYSGVARDKRFAELGDADLGRFCDFYVCLGSNGGYRSDCCDDQGCPPNAPSLGPFQLETTPLLGDLMDTCYESTYGEAAVPSRQDCISLFRSEFGACHVGLWEDCDREIASYPLGLTGAYGPDCKEMNLGCGG